MGRKSKEKRLRRLRKQKLEQKKKVQLKAKAGVKESARLDSDTAEEAEWPAASNKKPTKKDTAKTWKENIWPVIISIVGLVITAIVGNMLNNISPIQGYILFVSSLCVFFGYWTWRVVGWIKKCYPKIRLVRILTTALVIIIIFVTSPYYKDYLIKGNNSIEMPTFVDDSTQIFVHYGRRANDFFWTQKTVGELKQNPDATLKVNGQDILYIHTDGSKLYVDAILFGGYESQTVPGYTTIGSLANFSIEVSGYFITDSTAVGKSFQYKSQPTIIKNKALAPPVVIKNNSFSHKPSGWEVHQNSTALEIDNENNIPVLVLQYKSPYEITVSGLFITSFGILKVDNSQAVIFEFGDSLSELGEYKVDRIFIQSIPDLFESERTYILEGGR